MFTPRLSSAQVITTSSLASAPEGAPAAMSMLGNTGARAPATPSMVKRPWTGSTWPTLPIGRTITRGRSKLAPPSKDRAWKNTPWRVWMSVPTQTTNTVPWLSVRIPQP